MISNLANNSELSSQSSYFIVRVELQEATPQSYDRLHHYMEGEGFSRKISFDNVGEMYLPVGEYYHAAVADKKEVLAKAMRASSKIEFRFALLLIEAVGLMGVGLAPVTS